MLLSFKRCCPSSFATYDMISHKPKWKCNEWNDFINISDLVFQCGARTPPSLLTGRRWWKTTVFRSGCFVRSRYKQFTYRWNNDNTPAVLGEYTTRWWEITSCCANTIDSAESLIRVSNNIQSAFDRTALWCGLEMCKSLQQQQSQLYCNNDYAAAKSVGQYRGIDNREDVGMVAHWGGCWKEDKLKQFAHRWNYAIIPSSERERGFAPFIIAVNRFGGQHHSNFE